MPGADDAALIVTIQLVELDRLVRTWVVTHRLAMLDGIMWALSGVGRGGVIWLAIGVVLASLRRDRWQALLQLVLAVLLTTIVADHLLKPFVARERPFVGMPQIAIIGGRPADRSFPSGHAANAFAGAFVLSRVAPSGRIVWWVLATLIAHSRVYLGVHYPLDVVGGALVGVACAAIVLRLSRWRSRRPTHHTA